MCDTTSWFCTADYAVMCALCYAKPFWPVRSLTLDTAIKCAKPSLPSPHSIPGLPLHPLPLRPLRFFPLTSPFRFKASEADSYKKPRVTCRAHMQASERASGEESGSSRTEQQGGKQWWVEECKRRLFQVGLCASTLPSFAAALHIAGAQWGAGERGWESAQNKGGLHKEQPQQSCRPSNSQRQPTTRTTSPSPT